MYFISLAFPCVKLVQTVYPLSKFSKFTRDKNIFSGKECFYNNMIDRERFNGALLRISVLHNYIDSATR